MIKIQLLGKFGLGLHADTENVLGCVKLMLSAKESEELFLDFSKLDFLYPSGINILVLIGRHLQKIKHCKIRQNYPEKVEVRNFLTESGFCKEIGVSVPVDSSVPPHNGSYIYTLKNFTWPDDYEIEKLIDVIEKELKLSQLVRRHLHENLAELIMNVQQHSSSSLGCYVIGQGYTNSHRVRFCIGDIGVGIKNHLGKKYEDLLKKNAAEAIELSLKEGVTGTFGNQNSGVGLYYLTRFIDFCGESLIILSGDGYYVGGTEKQKVVLDFEFPGTLIDVAIKSEPGLIVFHKSEKIPKEYKLIK